MADPVQQVLDRGAGRVTRINETTRDRVQSIIADGVANDLTMGQIADSIERFGGPAFDEYRAELISRTELMFAYNTAALGSYGEAGVTMVTAIDGDQDEMCAARNGRDFPVQDAYGIEDHPNGTLDWVPVIGPSFVSALPEPEPVALPGPATPAQLEQTAKDLVAKASRAEPQVTRDLVDIGKRTGLNPNASFELDGKTLRTLDARLKTEASTLRKVTTEAAENPTLTAEQIGDRMKDNLRYTYIAEKEEYNTAVDRAIRELEARGYTPLRATNYWTYENGYAGLNTNWQTADGQLFELQFHTQQGLELKEVQSHHLYEEMRVLPSGSAEAQAIQVKIDELWASFRRENLGLGDIPLEDVFPDVRSGPLTFERKIEQTAADIFRAGRVSAPVSDAFAVVDRMARDAFVMRDPRYRTVVEKVKSALATIDRRFHDGLLPQMPQVGPLINQPVALQGAYSRMGSFPFDPVSLEFRTDAQMPTVFHEITHFLDQWGLGTGEWYGSVLGANEARGVADLLLRGMDAATAAQLRARGEIMAPVMRAIFESQGFRNLVAKEALDPKWVQYATEAREAFARAMAQWLTTRTGNAADWAALRARVYWPDSEIERAFSDQWTEADFDPIDRAITAMLREVGWLE